MPPTSSTTVLLLVLVTLVPTVSCTPHDDVIRESPCNRHGKLGADGKCECDRNYYGERCIDEICVSGGRPHRAENGTIWCSCPYGLEGRRCELTNSCENGVLQPEGWCRCQSGWDGRRCDVNIPCFHGVLTETETDNHLCDCHPGFQGFICNEKVPCDEGLISEASGNCECFPGFSGEACNITAKAQPESLVGLDAASCPGCHLMVNVGFGVAGLVAAMCAAYMLVRRYRRVQSMKEEEKEVALLL